MSDEHAKRKAISRAQRQANPLHSVLSTLRTAQFTQTDEQTPIEEEIMKAKCKRYAGRSVVIGSTVFSFDAEGVCELPVNSRGNAPKDFATLCAQNGVEACKEDAAQEVVEEVVEEVAQVVKPEAEVKEEPKAEEPVEEPTKEPIAEEPEAVEEAEEVKESKPKSRFSKSKKKKPSKNLGQD